MIEGSLNMFFSFSKSLLKWNHFLFAMGPSFLVPIRLRYYSVPVCRDWVKPRPQDSKGPGRESNRPHSEHKSGGSNPWNNMFGWSTLIIFTVDEASLNWYMEQKGRLVATVCVSRLLYVSSYLWTVSSKMIENDPFSFRLYGMWFMWREWERGGGYTCGSDVGGVHQYGPWQPPRRTQTLLKVDINHENGMEGRQANARIQCVRCQRTNDSFPSVLFRSV
jgi:hypothetical protein